jgi:hypothetical protein
MEENMSSRPTPSLTRSVTCADVAISLLFSVGVATLGSPGPGLDVAAFIGALVGWWTFSALYDFLKWFLT